MQGGEQRRVLEHISSEGKKALHDLQRHHVDAPPGVALKVSPPPRENLCAVACFLGAGSWALGRSGQLLDAG